MVEKKQSETNVVPRREDEIRVIAREWIYGHSRGIKSQSPFSHRLLSFSVRGQQPHFFLPAACLLARASSLSRALDAAQMRPQLPLFRRSLSELAAPSKSYHTLYLESQLMPPPLSRDHPLIIDEPPPFLRSSCGIYRCPFPLSPRHSHRECLKKEHALMENRNRWSR